MPVNSAQAGRHPTPLADLLRVRKDSLGVPVMVLYTINGQKVRGL